jgi:hypothetical protein
MVTVLTTGMQSLSASPRLEGRRALSRCFTGRERAVEDLEHASVGTESVASRPSEPLPPTAQVATQAIVPLPRAGEPIGGDHQDLRAGSTALGGTMSSACRWRRQSVARASSPDIGWLAFRAKTLPRQAPRATVSAVGMVKPERCMRVRLTRPPAPGHTAGRNT